MAAAVHFAIDPATGAVRCVYSDEGAAIVQEATGDVAPHIWRASHVEPGNGGWMADMSPSLPPGLTPPMAEWMLGPFKTRAEALAAELDWLKAHRGI